MLLCERANEQTFQILLPHPLPIAMILFRPPIIFLCTLHRKESPLNRLSQLILIHNRRNTVTQRTLNLILTSLKNPHSCLFKALSENSFAFRFICLPATLREDPFILSLM